TAVLHRIHDFIAGRRLPSNPAPLCGRELSRKVTGYAGAIQGVVRAMKVFISYSRHDAGAVRSMVSDLQRARVQVWLDEQLGGGDAWWSDILEQIRGSTA